MAHPKASDVEQNSWAPGPLEVCTYTSSNKNSLSIAGQGIISSCCGSTQRSKAPTVRFTSIVECREYAQTHVEGNNWVSDAARFNRRVDQLFKMLTHNKGTMP